MQFHFSLFFNNQNNLKTKQEHEKIDEQKFTGVLSGSTLLFDICSNTNYVFCM